MPLERARARAKGQCSVGIALEKDTHPFSALLPRVQARMVPHLFAARAKAKAMARPNVQAKEVANTLLHQPRGEERQGRAATSTAKALAHGVARAKVERDMARARDQVEKSLRWTGPKIGPRTGPSGLLKPQPRLQLQSGHHSHQQLHSHGLPQLPPPRPSQHGLHLGQEDLGRHLRRQQQHHRDQ